MQECKLKLYTRFLEYLCISSVGWRKKWTPCTFMTCICTRASPLHLSTEFLSIRDSPDLKEFRNVLWTQQRTVPNFLCVWCVEVLLEFDEIHSNHLKNSIPHTARLPARRTSPRKKRDPLNRNIMLHAHLVSISITGRKEDYIMNRTKDMGENMVPAS